MTRAGGRRWKWYGKKRYLSKYTSCAVDFWKQTDRLHF